MASGFYTHKLQSYLVEFMYTGEVAVEQEHLTKLLEAAKSLQIKGLYETSEDEDKDLKDNQPEIPPPLEDNNVTGSQKRKIRKSSENSSPKKIKVENSSPPPPPPTTSPPAPVFPSSPLFGISNAYFLNNPGLPSAPNKDPANPVTAKILQDLPKLLSQSPLPLPGNLNNSTANVCKIDRNELSNAPVRRYKQYTEDTLQQALKVKQILKAEVCLKILIFYLILGYRQRAKYQSFLNEVQHSCSHPSRLDETTQYQIRIYAPFTKRRTKFEFGFKRFQLGRGV